jgi:serine/threonine-protein kinase
VVHRDIKPQNVVVCSGARAGRRAKLMDFGIARIAGAPTLTAAGEVVGTLAYMSPEQAEGELAGPPTDVYSLALTAYECWAGEHPIAGSSPAQTARRIGGAIEPLRVVRPDLPEGLADTIDACLDPEAELRPTPGELRECLEAEIPGLDAMQPLPGASGAEDGFHSPAARPATMLALLPVALAPLLPAIGAPGAGAALGAGGPAALVRAVLGVLAWLWMVAGAAIIGFDPVLAVAPQEAADPIGAQLATVESLCAGGIFALGSVTLGWVLRARHLAFALLGAMIWAAGVDAALSLADADALGGGPVGVVAAAAIAVGVEFGVLRGAPERRTPRALRISTT